MCAANCLIPIPRADVKCVEKKKFHISLFLKIGHIHSHNRSITFTELDISGVVLVLFKFIHVFFSQKCFIRCCAHFG